MGYNKTTPKFIEKFRLKANGHDIDDKKESKALGHTKFDTKYDIENAQVIKDYTSEED